MTKEEQLIITKYDLLFESRLTKVECGYQELSDTVKEIKQDIKDVKKLLHTIIGVVMTSIIIPIILKRYGFM